MTTRTRLGPTLVVGEFEITPLERITLRHRRLGRAHAFEGSKRPVALLVRSRGRSWRIELDSSPEDAGRPGDAGGDP